MLSHRETRVLPYTPKQLFDLVADVERYPEFLPWCKGARLRAKGDKIMEADLVIGTRLFSETFTSLVTLERYRAIEVRYMAGPLSRLANRWGFRPAGKGACELSFEVDFDFRSPLLRAAMEVLFDKALRRMASAFEARAAALYGPADR